MNSNKQPSPTQYLNLYFQVHQPRRLQKFEFFDIGSGAGYFDDDLNKMHMERIAAECYIPANHMLFRLIQQIPSLRITFSISGTALEQMELYAPEVIPSFRQLADTGAVEFLGETYYHSLAALLDEDEFAAQVLHHRSRINKLFGFNPTVFRNTELIYSDAIARSVFRLGFKGMYLEGTERMFPANNVRQLHMHPESDLVLFPRHYKLSDDIAFRFADRHWSEWPLTDEKFTSWLKQPGAQGNFTTLGMDYETFGEHQKAVDGIFLFLKKMIIRISQFKRFRFINPTEAISILPLGQPISATQATSWADREKDLSAWLGNDMQKDAFRFLKKLHFRSRLHGGRLQDELRYLQTSDHYYYMSTKKDEDGKIHQYFSPFRSPYEAFMNYINILSDIEYIFQQEDANRRLVQKLEGTLSLA